MIRSTCLAAVFCAVAAFPVFSQETPPGGAPEEKPASVDANASKLSPLEALKKADEAARGSALAAYIDANIATNAIFSGQYDALADLGWDATPMLRSWLAKAPDGAKTPDPGFRIACVRALRDCVKEAPEDLITELQALVASLVTPDLLKSPTKYALAQFGKTEHVDAMIQAAMKNTTATNSTQKVGAWRQLADVYYNIRRYEDATKAYRQVITTIEGLNPNFQSLPTTYYNCACSYALAGNKAEALKHVKLALEKGKKIGRPMSARLLKTDMDIRSLRGEPEFAALMYEYFKIGEAPASKPTAESKPMK